MQDPTHSTIRFLLTTGKAGRISVDVESFIDFNVTMNERLRELEKRWADLAAPQPNPYRRLCRRAE